MLHVSGEAILWKTVTMVTGEIRTAGPLLEQFVMVGDTVTHDKHFCHFDAQLCLILTMDKYKCDDKNETK